MVGNNGNNNVSFIYTSRTASRLIIAVIVVVTTCITNKRQRQLLVVSAENILFESENLTKSSNTIHYLLPWIVTIILLLHICVIVFLLQRSNTPIDTPKLTNLINLKTKSESPIQNTNSNNESHPTNSTILIPKTKLDNYKKLNELNDLQRIKEDKNNQSNDRDSNKSDIIGSTNRNKASLSIVPTTEPVEMTTNQLLSSSPSKISIWKCKCDIGNQFLPPSIFGNMNNVLRMGSGQCYHTSKEM
jgi:hypothetical protein